MVGSGKNKKSIGYVGNIADFLIFSMNFDRGFRLYNYADKPNLSMNELIETARAALGIRNGRCNLRIPYHIGLLGGCVFDLLAGITGRAFSISSIRIKKFCAETTISTNRLLSAGFRPAYELRGALEQTIRSELLS